MNKNELLEGFNAWFEHYFVNTQGEDSPYSYKDIKAAYYAGYRYAEGYRY